MKEILIGCLAFCSATIFAQDTTKATHSWEVRMAKKDEPGKKFTLDITVLDISTKQPVKDAEVFAYHTNYKGDYENDPATGIAKIHATAWSNEKGQIRFITIYPRGYNDSPTGEHIHFRTKARGYSGGGTDLSFWDYQRKQLDYNNPIVTKVYLETLEEKNGELFGKALLYMKKN